MAKLYFYYSCMNAGKTTLLLQNHYNYQTRGMKTLLITPAVAGNVIHSRLGVQEQSIVLRPTGVINEDLLKDVKAIFIDEAQFLNKLHVHQLCRIVDSHDIQIYCYGLRTDYTGNPFEGSLYLLALADVLIEIKTTCDCGRKAIMNHRLVDSDTLIDIGHDKYKSYCRKCWNELNFRI